MVTYMENETHETMEDAGPQEGDYIISSGRGTHVSEHQEGGGKYLGEFANQDEAEAFIRQRMDKEQFWPNVWTCSDHGNLNLIVLPPKPGDEIDDPD
jgi:hypothetical protein